MDSAGRLIFKVRKMGGREMLVKLDCMKRLDY